MTEICCSVAKSVLSGLILREPFFFGFLCLYSSQLDELLGEKQRLYPMRAHVPLVMNLLDGGEQIDRSSSCFLENFQGLALIELHMKLPQNNRDNQDTIFDADLVIAGKA